jgi:hypothetical protein
MWDFDGFCLALRGMQVLHRASQCLINDKATQLLASLNEHGTENGTHKLLGRKRRANLSDLGEQTWQQGYCQSIAYRSAKRRFNGGIHLNPF